MRILKTPIKLTSLASALLLMACNTAPQTDPAYVSPNHYSDYNCNQISAEMRRVSSKMQQIERENQSGQVLDAALAAYAMSQGYGYSGGDDTEHRRLVNQYDILEQTAIRKECNI